MGREISSKRQFAESVKALFLAGLLFSAGQATAQETEAEPSYRELLEILKTAKPAPNPPPPPGALRGPGGPGATIEHDPETGRSTVLPQIRRRQIERVPGQAGAGQPRAHLKLAPTARGNYASPESRDGSAKITPTRPAPLTEVLSYPWNTVYKMLMRFNVNGTNFYYVCSASARSSFHLLTAGHCIYNRDPNDDGNTADRRWAEEIWTWAAQTDRVVPIGTLDHPYGLAKVTYMRSYTQWTNDGNLNYDYGLVTLDRRQGSRTGWMGAETSLAASLNFNGYPTETPHVPAGEYRQYPGFDANNVVSASATYITLDAYTYGGHSGGPAWRYDASSGGRWVQGINSTSNRAGRAGETRITSYIISDFQSAASTDESARPPATLPNLIEYLFATTAKDLLTNSTVQGDPITVEYNLLNAGFANAGAIAVDFYLSTDTTISTADTFIGTRSFSSLDQFTYTNPIATLTVPTSQPVGAYYVGWIMRTSPESETDDNTVVISNEQVQVNERLLPPDQVSNLIAPAGRSGRRPTFQWSPVARATSYQVQVRKGTSTPFSGVFTAASLGCSDGVSTCQFRLSASERLRVGRHRWRVQASNAAGPSPYSAFKYFYVRSSRQIAGLE